MSKDFVWQGRVDHEETGDARRWHQAIRPFDAGAQHGVSLVGYAVDEGVRRNGGRVGAAQGPAALRLALSNMPINGEPALWDAGDVVCGAEALEEAQQELATRVATAITRGSRPIVLGGGHDMAWGTFQGIKQARPNLQRLLVVNLDAHFDLRMAARANSGTPFRQMAEWCERERHPFMYHVLGISRYGNTRALFDRADALGVHYTLDNALHTDAGLQRVTSALADALDECDGVYLTICLDVLPAHVAPGVSAPAALGVPLHVVEQLVDVVTGSKKLIAFDIAELNPACDEGDRTARTAARLVARVARG